jgi:hypothetical protein
VLAFDQRHCASGGGQGAGKRHAGLTSTDYCGLYVDLRHADPGSFCFCA